MSSFERYRADLGEKSAPAPPSSNQNSIKAIAARSRDRMSSTKLSLNRELFACGISLYKFKPTRGAVCCEIYSSFVTAAWRGIDSKIAPDIDLSDRELIGNT